MRTEFDKAVQEMAQFLSDNHIQRVTAYGHYIPMSGCELSEDFSDQVRRKACELLGRTSSEPPSETRVRAFIVGAVAELNSSVS